MNEPKRNDFIAQALIDLAGAPNAHGRVLGLYRAMQKSETWTRNPPEYIGKELRERDATTGKP